MFCRMCGKQILDDSKFCQYCGVKVAMVEETQIDKVIILTEQEAKNGVEKEIQIDGMKAPIKMMFPKNTMNGQLFRLYKVKMVDSNGKKDKKDLYIKTEVKSNTKGE